VRRSAQIQVQEIDMEFVDIPATSLRVSRVALGTWAMGRRLREGADERASIATIRAAIDQGINLIDTAPVYGFGVSEEIVGRAVAAANIRSHMVIATKVGLEWRDGKIYRNATRDRIMHEIDLSLRRLRTDYIDIYQVHWPDPRVPIEETAEAMRTLYDRGKIRAVGVSNFSVAQMECFRRIAPLHVLQPPYNLFERAIEADVLPYTRKHNIVTLGYGALCRGLLSGRMRADTSFDGDDLRRIDPKFQPPRFTQYLSAVRQLDLLARDRFLRRVIHLAIRWMFEQGISVALWGGRHPDQIHAALGVSGWSLDAASLAKINRILGETITDPIGPEFMSPPSRSC
jgi:aryl-alcohol dehydrogenase-like predicted oxidoreductase